MKSLCFQFMIVLLDVCQEMFGIIDWAAEDRQAITEAKVAGKRNRMQKLHKCVVQVLIMFNESNISCILQNGCPPWFETSWNPR